MSDKSALVTGAGSRLGRAMALKLGEMGYDVAVHYAQSAGGAEQTVAELEAMGRKAVAIQADLLDLDQTEALVGHAAKAVGELSVLVNNASIFEYDSIETATRDTWDRHLGSNLRAPFILTQAFSEQVPDTVDDAQGEPVSQAAVINMIDQRVRKLTPEFMTYTIAKYGLWGFTQTAARALAPFVRVNAIGPGPTLQGGRQSADHFKEQRISTVLRRGSNTDDITNALQYIVSSPALTGQLLCIDGGQHLGWETPDVIGVE